MNKYAQVAKGSRIRQVQVVFRHGDRSPVFNAFEGTPSHAAEAGFWHQKCLGNAASSSSLSAEAAVVPPARLSMRFPVHSFNMRAHDGHDLPWGVLTTRGAAQATERGRRLGARYQQLLEEAIFGEPSSSFPSSSSSSSSSFSKTTRIGAAASNFARTQLSCQYVLNGLLSPIPSTSSSTSTSTSLPSFTGVGVPIQVAPANICTIGVFNSGNGIMVAARKIFNSPIVTNREAELAKISDALIKAVPYFAPRVVGPSSPPSQTWGEGTSSTPTSSSSSTSVTSSAVSSFSSSTLVTKTPPPVSYVGDNGLNNSKFLWIRAYDYFHCSWSHGKSVVPAVAHLHRITHDHLIWRFRTIFENPQVLSLASCNLLYSILSNMEDLVAMESNMKKNREGKVTLKAPVKEVEHTKEGGAHHHHHHHHQHTQDQQQRTSSPPLVQLYSGHDVTLMPLLYCLATGAATAGTPVHCVWPSGDTKSFTLAKDVYSVVPWPGYSAAISFELQQQHHNEIEDNKKDDATTTLQSDTTSSASSKPTTEKWSVHWKFDNEELILSTPPPNLHTDDDDEKKNPSTPNISEDVVSSMSGYMSLQQFKNMIAAMDRVGPKER